MENVGATLKGIYRDILKNNDGEVVRDSGWVSNTIVERCRILLAGFLKNDSSEGIKYLAVGRGLDTWDDAGTPSPDSMATNLATPYSPPIPVTSLGIVYLDEEDHEVTSATNRLQITAIMGPGYPAPLAPLSAYPLREFGLFGRFGGADFMINSIRHPVIHKDTSATLVRMIRLYF